MVNNSTVFIQGMQKEHSQKQLENAIEKVFLESTNNLSWLKQGDKVLLKPALNSSDIYPATTHPILLKVVSRLLKRRGAIVFAGDQSGIEHVVHDESGVIFGSSKDCYRKSLMKESGVKFIAFEDKGWEHFKKFKPNLVNSSWNNGFYITKIIDEVDHIINLPRISSHIQTGVTLGMKNLVGLLRQDSRIEFHNDGPFSFTINNFAKKSKRLRTNYENQYKFFEKMAEIYLTVKNKLRLTMFVATKIQTTIGPDSKVISLLKSYVSTPDTGLIIASDNLLTADATALSFLISEYKKIPLSKKIPNKFTLLFNHQIKELGKENLWENKFLKSGINIGVGNKNFSINYKNIPNRLIKEIKSLLD